MNYRPDLELARRAPILLSETNVCGVSANQEGCKQSCANSSDGTFLGHTSTPDNTPLAFRRRPTIVQDAVLQGGAQVTRHLAISFPALLPSLSDVTLGCLAHTRNHTQVAATPPVVRNDFNPVLCLPHTWKLHPHQPPMVYNPVFHSQSFRKHSTIPPNPT